VEPPKASALAWHQVFRFWGLLGVRVAQPWPLEDQRVVREEERSVFSSTASCFFRVWVPVQSTAVVTVDWVTPLVTMVAEKEDSVMSLSTNQSLSPVAVETVRVPMTFVGLPVWKMLTTVTPAVAPLQNTENAPTHMSSGYDMLMNGVLTVVEE